jgi:hypothetical protein
MANTVIDDEVILERIRDLEKLNEQSKQTLNSLDERKDYDMMRYLLDDRHDNSIRIMELRKLQNPLLR